jgi:hypothetical protein
MFHLEPPVPARRQFLRIAGLAGVLSALRVSGFASLAAAQSAGAKRADSTAVTPSPSPAANQPPSEDARALAAVLGRRYPNAIGAAELEIIARDIEGDLRNGQRLREARLANADEPDFTFRA